MDTKISLEYYSTFYHVATLGSISKAAEAMHLTQPAVSHIISRLEDNLGCRLFFRKPKGVELTDAGKTLLPYVDSMLNQIQAGERKIRRISSLNEGNLYIGAVDTTYSILPRIISNFSRAYPNIRIHLFGPSTNQVIEGINDGTLDLGFVLSPFDDNKELYTLYPLTESRDIIVAGNKYNNLKGKSIPIEELLDYPFVCLKKGTSGRSYLERYCAMNGMQFKPSCSVPSPNNIVPLVTYNLGLGVVIEAFVRKYIADGSLFEVNVIPRLPSRQLYMIVSRKFEQNAACREFMRFVELEN